jgi:sulfatase modifying factor 1
MTRALAVLGCLVLLAAPVAWSQDAAQAPPRVLVHGYLRFRNLLDLKDINAEKTRLVGVLTAAGATGVRWVDENGDDHAGRLEFTALDSAYLPQLIPPLEFKPDPDIPDAKIRMHQFLDCSLTGELQTVELRAGIVTTVTFRVTPAKAKLYYVRDAAKGEEAVPVDANGNVSLTVRLVWGQRYIYARTQLLEVKRWIKVDAFDGTVTDVPEDEYSKNVSGQITTAPVTPRAPGGAGAAGAGGNAWERQGTKVGEEIISPDGGKMVWVPAGEFMMGSLEGEGNALEHPQHRVRITRGFWLGKCEVTNEQYRAFCDATGRGLREESRNGPKHPVVYVSWEDAKAYCDHYGLALPTEAQWEYAARGPEGRKYPWGNEWDAKKCCNRDNRGAGVQATMEVGSLPAGDSWCGASDLAGNVWEWCADWYGEDYYAGSPQDDPQGPASGDCRLLRGGSWDYNGGLCRSAFRYYDVPWIWYDYYGFRVSRTP